MRPLRLDLATSAMARDVFPSPVRADTSMPGGWQEIPKRRLLPFGLPQPTVRSCLPFVQATGLGWLVPAPTDLRVIADGSGGLSVDGGHTNGVDLGGNFSLHLSAPPPNAYSGILPSFVVKVDTPYYAATDRRTDALVLPLLNRQTNLVAVSGLLATSVAPLRVNLNLMWIGGKADEVIAAGTPLAQVVPVPSRTVRRRYRLLTEEEERAVTVWRARFTTGSGVYWRKFGKEASR